MSSDMRHQRLIEQAHSGNSAALEELLFTHMQTLHRHVQRRMPKHANAPFDVEDVVQEAMLVAFQRIGNLREVSVVGFVAWLKSIGELSLLRLIRDENRQKRGGHLQRETTGNHSDCDRILDILDRLPNQDRTASSIVARDQAVAALRIAIAALPADQRNALELHLINGKTLDQTAAMMKRTPEAIRGLVYRGKQNLAEAMGRASAWISG